MIAKAAPGPCRRSVTSNVRSVLRESTVGVGSGIFGLLTCVISDSEKRSIGDVPLIPATTTAEKKVHRVIEQRTTVRAQRQLIKVNSYSWPSKKSCGWAFITCCP